MGNKLIVDNKEYTVEDLNASQNISDTKPNSAPTIPTAENRNTSLESFPEIFKNTAKQTTSNQQAELQEKTALLQILRSGSRPNHQHKSPMVSKTSSEKDLLQINNQPNHFGIDANSAVFLISIIAIVNIVFRVVFGDLADLPKVSAFLLNNLSAGYIALTPILLVDLMDLDKLTNAFGFIMMFRGFATLIGLLIGGALYDATKSYYYAFFFAGGLFAVGATISFAAPPFKRKKTVDKDEALMPMNAGK
ncbi:hypothetical protein JTB14_023012 [Gonioctena quinquepunctata]|nr:hypothetical protein JTB14_023012 [Gonioctena quinquepunctata]